MKIKFPLKIYGQKCKHRKVLYTSPHLDTIPIPLIAYSARSVSDVLFFFLISSYLVDNVYPVFLIPPILNLPGTNPGLLRKIGMRVSFPFLGVSVVRAGVAWRPPYLPAPIPPWLPPSPPTPLPPALAACCCSLPACLLSSLLPVSLPVPPAVLPFQPAHLLILRYISSFQGIQNTKLVHRVSRHTSPYMYLAKCV